MFFCKKQICKQCGNFDNRLLRNFFVHFEGMGLTHHVAWLELSACKHIESVNTAGAQWERIRCPDERDSDGG